MKLAPQRLVNLTVAEKPPLEEIKDLQAAIKVAEEELQDNGRVLIRYSGTQSMCRVMVEGPTEQMTHRLTDDLAAVVKKCIG
jgi:phosphoglucosamine mutase